MNVLSEQELQRYQRQIIIFDKKGQEKLKKAKVFIAGAGGLGCPIALYLASAGVGNIEIADNDVVELTNLNRQILHWDQDIGLFKTQSIEQKLRLINPYINIKTHNTTINLENIKSFVQDADIIVDALDNFETRYLLNTTSLETGITLVFGAIRGFDGQVTTIVPGETACLECIFQQAPPKEVFPVIGVTSGIIGLIQANEVLKCLLHMGNPLKNKLLHWDGLSATMQQFSIKKRENCAACGVLQ